ncbi:unnamed protein product [Clonostachys rhizophaga]|uniref:Uncharacterized protein n=1 Tax=Clonostachys rhizophaga TaxID=160324 RepID=A0A9N9YGL3_9HYPO|nr:unnamed protein product [Clonostachys rhizophaga]
MDIGPITMLTRMWNEQDLKRSEPETLQAMWPLLSFISGNGCMLESLKSYAAIVVEAEVDRAK